MAERTREILVFGANGQVARELTRARAPSGFAVHGLTHADADIADAGAVDAIVERRKPAVIVNAAAYTAVDKAESEPERAFAVNERGPRHLAMAAREAGAALIHFSTDYVFDGRKCEPYIEDDPIAPASVYGRSKAAGEAAVRETTPRHVILRTAWVYSGHGVNFLRTMIRLARERDVVRVVADQEGTPTAAADLAAAILAIVPQLDAQSAAFGTFHLTNGGRTTWHGFAQEIFATLAHCGETIPRLEAITTADYPTAARRPAMSVLDCGRIESSYGIRLPPWRSPIAAAVREALGRADGGDRG